MPWGRFRGRRLDTIPLGYLCWCLENIRTWDADLAEAVREEVCGRVGVGGHRAYLRHRRPPARLQDVGERLIGAGVRSLARRAHPDAGGSHDEMTAINGVADWLPAATREADSA